MLKVGIVTFHFSDNIGAMLQAYALRKWFLDRGCNADFINYHPRHVEEGGALQKPWNIKLWRRNLTIIYLWINSIRRSLSVNKAASLELIRFRKDYLGISGQRFLSEKQLELESFNFDLIVCGSDQIWNPSVQRGFDEIYFLNTHAFNGGLKVSYAASFGQDNLANSLEKQINLLLGDLHAISVREASGVEIIKRATSGERKATVVPDPTILLGDFSSLMPPSAKSSSNGIFCYALRSDRGVREVANWVSDFYQEEIYSPRSVHQRWGDIGTGRDVDPCGWCKLLYESRFVVTNSFHGVAMSLIFRRPFVAVALVGKKEKMNARVKNLLSQVGLTNRFLPQYDQDMLLDLINNPIDWECVDAEINNMRRLGEKYLEEQISQATSLKTLSRKDGNNG